jgi:aminoglycoside/choline kinase family phosphotransferase
VRDFPVQPEELSTPWLTDVLRAAGALGPSTEVSGFELSYIGDGVGLLGMVLRVTLQYSGSVDGAGPGSVVIKFAHPVAANRAIAANTNMYEREVTFFNAVAPEVDVPMPRCYFAAMDVEAGENIVMLEDLHDYRAGDQVKGATVAEVRAIIDAIVPLHAKFWGRAEGRFPGMMQVNSSYIEPFMPGIEGTWENAITQFGHCMTPEVREALPRYVRHLRSIMRANGDRTMTLIHGDVRIDNVMFGDGRPGLLPVVMLDWQAIMVSNPMQDMAWMLSTGVSTSLRRAHEDEMLEYYRHRLADHGVDDYSQAQARDDYDMGLLWMLCYPVIIGGAFDPANARGRELAEEGLRRSTAAVTDRGLLARVPA